METREQLESLLEHTEDVVVVLDADGRITYESAAVSRVLGYRRGELVGDVPLEYFHPEDRSTVTAAFQAVRRGGSGATRQFEHRVRTNVGGWVWLDTILTNRLDSELSGFVVSARDVTDRKRVERERNRTHDRLLALTERANDVLWMFTADWSDVLFVNSAYDDVYGRSAETLRETPSDFLNGVHPDDRDRVLRGMARLTAGEPVDLEYRVDETEAYRRRVWMQGEPVVEDGEVVRIVGFTRDVTDRRERERHLQVIDRVLRHNLQNAMNVVMGYAEHTADEYPATRPYMRSILESAAALLESVEKERAIVELLSDPPAQEVVDVVTAIRDAASSVRSNHDDLAVDLSLPDRATVRAVPWLARAIEELLENAVDHADADDDVSVGVTVRSDEDAVRIVVTDDGRGIPGQEVAVLHDDQDIAPLFHGSGMGLWLVNWIVRLSDGTVSFRERDPHGTVVTIRLPRAAAFA